MAIDRSEVRRRVKAYTAWIAGGATVLTTAFAFGAARDDHKAAANPPSPTVTEAQTPSQDDLQGTYQQQDPSQGFTPPAASTAPPSGMSGGS